MRVAPTKKMRFKLNIVVFSVIVLLVIYISTTLFSVSVLQQDLFKSLANSQQMQSLTINAHRGSIYDNTGEVLAQSSTVWQVVMSPIDINENASDKDRIPEICKNISGILEVDYDNLLERSKDTKNAFYIIKRKVEKPDIDRLNEYLTTNEVGSTSIYTVEESKREYPNESLASNILGFTDYENKGVYGIEAYYDDYLKGVDGKIMFAKDKDGNQMPFADDARFEATDGNNIHLTIDKVLQHYLEKNLELAVSQNSVENRATGIIMNAKTGAILAMATSPSYDLNNPATIFYQKDRDYLASLSDVETSDNEEEGENSSYSEEFIEAEESRLRELQWKNKAVTELYYPGSIFKVITAASALEEEVCTIHDSFSCSGVSVVSGQPIKCWKSGGHGTLSFTEAMIKSCNPSFISIGQKLGANKFYKYFEAFGFTEKTGIDLPGEENSIYVREEKMGPVELASSSFGQTNKITPVQMITAYAAAVNGGKLMTPYVVEKIVDNNGNVIKTTQPTVKRQVISEETSEQMREILETVVDVNGGNNAYIPGFRIGGKSGTSEKIDQYNETGVMRYVSTFGGFAPANNPEIIMLVCVDEPTGEQFYGSAVAAPVVSSVFKEGLPYLGIHPEYTKEELEKMDTVTPYVVGLEGMRAESQLNAKGLNVEFVGNTDGTTVKRQIPESGALIPNGGKVVVYMEDVEIEKGFVPNVIGMTLEESNEALANAGFNIRTVGGAVENADARARLQSIDPETKMAKGTIVEVTFGINDETG